MPVTIDGEVDKPYNVAVVFEHYAYVQAQAPEGMVVKGYRVVRLKNLTIVEP